MQQDVFSTYFAACNRYHPILAGQTSTDHNFCKSNARFARNIFQTSVFVVFPHSAQVFMSFPVILMFFPKEFPHHFCPISSFSAGRRSAEHPTSEVRCQGATVERGAAGCARRGLVSARHGVGAWHRGSVPGIVGRFSRRILVEKNGSGEYGNLWEPMGIYGNLWESIGFRCFVWMEIHESTRWTMVLC